MIPTKSYPSHGYISDVRAELCKAGIDLLEKEQGKVIMGWRSGMTAKQVVKQIIDLRKV